MSGDSELDILRGMLDDDPQAWKAFYARYSRLIYRCITSVTSGFSGVVSPEDIEDVFADVAVSLLTNDKRRLRTYDPEKGSCLGSWIGGVAICRTLDFLRVVKRSPRRGGDFRDYDGSCEPDQGTVEAREQVMLLSRRLSLLSSRDQEFVRLYWFEGLTAVEVAQRMGLNVVTAYTKKHKVRARLEVLCADFI